MEKSVLNRKGNTSSSVTRGKVEGINVAAGEFADVGVGGWQFSSVCSMKWEAS